MYREEIKTVAVGVSKQCYIKLKIEALKRNLSIANYVKDILERHVCKIEMNEEKK